jgi:hypothetical protein
LFNNSVFQLSMLLLFIFFNSCDYKKQSIGEFDVIHVFADSSIYQKVSPALEQVFNQYIYTPRAEKSFYLQWQPIEKLGIYQFQKNLLFMGLFNQEDAASVYIMKMLSSDVQKAILDGNIFHIFQEDLFAKNQISIILFAPNITRLMDNIRQYGDDIYRELEKYHFKRLKENMFSIEEQKNLEDYLADHFGWKIQVQYEYKLIKQSDDGSFVWLKKIKPDRNIFIYRYNTTGFNDPDNFLFNLRDSLTTIYFEGDSIVRDNCYSIETEISGWPAIKLIGVWKNNKYLVGGPFRTYTFYDRDAHYQYVIDLSVMALDRRKKPYLDELEVIANSFQLIPQKMKQ